MELKVGETKEFDGLQIRLKDIIYEEIAEFLPDYPGGSGIVAEVSLSLGEKNTIIRLEQLPEGYESHLEQEWGGFLISLVEIGQDSVKLKLEKQNP